MQPMPPGITVEAGRGYCVEVRVRPFPKRRARFPFGTPIAVMLAWRDAQIAELKPARRLVDRGRPSSPSAPTILREDVEQYLAEKLPPTMHPDTRAQFTRWLRKAAETDLGRYPRQAITGALWSTLVDQWARTGIPATPGDGGRRRIVPPGPLAVDTVNKIRVCFIQFYEAMDRGLERQNPARFIPWRKPDHPEARGIPMAQALAIVAQVPPGTRTAARLLLMVTLGLRPVEIMRIKPATDWRRAERTLIVRTAKGGRARTLPLTDEAIAALEQLDRLKGWGTFTSAPAARMFHTAVAKAGLSALEPLRPYDLRHAFGTEAYRLTKDIKATAEAMGHKNLSQTERYVAGAVSDTVAALFQKVNAAMPRLVKTKRRHKHLREVK